MPTNADHLHYYILSKGRYKRKLICKDDATMIVLGGGRLVKPPENSRLWSSAGTITVETWNTAAQPFKNRITGKVYFPYTIFSTQSLKDLNVKIRAIKHNRCLQCGPLEAYWNQGGSNE